LHSCHADDSRASGPMPPDEPQVDLENLPSAASLSTSTAPHTFPENGFPSFNENIWGASANVQRTDRSATPTSPVSVRKHPFAQATSPSYQYSQPPMEPRRASDLPVVLSAANISPVDEIARRPSAPPEIGPHEAGPSKGKSRAGSTTGKSTITGVDSTPGPSPKNDRESREEITKEDFSRYETPLPARPRIRRYMTSPARSFGLGLNIVVKATPEDGLQARRDSPSRAQSYSTASAQTSGQPAAVEQAASNGASTSQSTIATPLSSESGLTTPLAPDPAEPQDPGRRASRMRLGSWAAVDVVDTHLPPSTTSIRPIGSISSYSTPTAALQAHAQAQARSSISESTLDLRRASAVPLPITDGLVWSVEAIVPRSQGEVEPTFTGDTTSKSQDALAPARQRASMDSALPHFNRSRGLLDEFGTLSVWSPAFATGSGTSTSQNLAPGTAESGGLKGNTAQSARKWVDKFGSWPRRQSVVLVGSMFGVSGNLDQGPTRGGWVRRETDLPVAGAGDWRDRKGSWAEGWTRD
jgi:hypothetical protein